MADTFQSFIGRLEKLKTVIAEKKDMIEVNALNAMHRLMSNRVFKNGLDVNKNPIGPYSPRYREIRRRLGLAYLNKNMYFDGDLFRSVQVGKAKSKNALGFTDQDEADIAAINEEREDTIIFEPNEAEIQIAEDILKEQSEKVIRECFR